MGSVDRRLAKLEKEHSKSAQNQKVHLLTEDDDIAAMIASGAAGADVFFIVMIMKDPAPSSRC